MEHLLYAAFQSSYDGIFVADADGNGLLANRAYLRVTGLQEQEIIGRNLRELLKAGIISDSVTLKVIEQNRPITLVLSVRGKEVLATGNPIRNAHGELTHVVSNVRDISELNNLKIELLLSIALKQKKQSEVFKENKQNRLPLPLADVVAESKEFSRVVALVHKVAKVDSTVLILGESGVGKEVVVKMIHMLSERAKHPFVKVNCAAIPHHLLESELFGYEKGAFTGADSRGKPGLFEQANGGTIFLDEIGDMPLDLQVKLLRVLQEFEITRIGGRSSVKVNVRVISATNKQLDKMVEKGEFRKDLFYRLNIVPIKIPPLRERKADIAALAYSFLDKMNAKYLLSKRFHPGVLQVMEQYDWPGNIREMENTIERLVVTTDHEEIGWSDLPFITENVPQPQENSLKKLLQDVERKIIAEKLEEFKTTRRAAQALGISQSALVKKMQRFAGK